MQTVKAYTGVGSRQTPVEIQQLMERAAGQLAQKGYLLRSGGARGADQAFERGCHRYQGRKTIYVPWEGFNNYKILPNDVLDLLSIHFDVLDGILLDAGFDVIDQLRYRASKGDQKAYTTLLLFRRNVYQVIGYDANALSRFLICWTPDGAVESAELTKQTGGTRIAIGVADYYGIPVFNLKRDDHYNRIANFVSEEVET